ncbi:MAG: tRNA dihydrouridine(20/20a) synthase DusA [Gammaproteobacteria bacterium]|nr:tRNA dihydrouridine(20/20a) synthase DusA [Gammaproteobacteria bacterium]
MLNNTFSVAPMLDWTDRHQRYFMRLISHHALLYTEMVTTGAIIFGDRDRYLQFNDEEHPVSLQLGGSDVKHLAECTKIAEDYGYDEVNLNLGCPSNRVQNGSFGACMMAQPELVAECITAMKAAANMTVSAKTRIGIDDRDSFEELVHFVGTLHEAGCDDFVIHARKAILQGLSPKENRSIPPLKYDVVYKIKELFPQCHISLNGGVKTLAETREHLQQVDGVMMGREAYHNPYLLSEIDCLLYDDNHPLLTRHQLVESMFPYIEKEMAKGVRLQSIVRHMLGVFQGVNGTKAWKRFLSENAYKESSGIEVLQHALTLVSQGNAPQDEETSAG